MHRFSGALILVEILGVFGQANIAPTHWVKKCSIFLSDNRDSESAYFSRYCIISPKSPHSKRVRANCFIEQKTPMRMLGQYGVLSVRRISDRATRNERLIFITLGEAPISDQL